MMYLNDESLTFNYMEDDEIQILELPYKGDNLSMILMLPKENNISILESQFNWNQTQERLSHMTKESVRITIPKFTFETEYSLKEVLQSMGMQQPFTMDADFSGMNGNKDLYIDKVLHNAFVQVDEVGTEAAAATTVHISLTSLPPPEIEFTADHPFIFFIQHNQTGNILFLGKIMNPQ
jgi:serpin B